MAFAQLLEVVSLLAFCHGGATFDYKLRAQEQVRVGLINTPGATGQVNTVTFAEIISPSGEAHATFREQQDLLLRYQPRFLDSLRYYPASAGVPSSHTWTGWTTMHRALVTYKVGEEHNLAFTGQFNLSIGKQDLGSGDQEVIDSGFLPGKLGQLINYTYVNAIFGAKHRLSRNIRLSTQETIGLTQYTEPDTVGYFANMPQINLPSRQGTKTQYRLLLRAEAEYLLNARSSLFADVDLTDISYQDTATFPAFAPSLGYGTTWAGPGKLKLQAGFIKYWVNPLPGQFERPGYLPTLNVTLTQTFAQLGLPKLTANVIVGLLPYYNLQFSSLEPRSTFTLQLNYAFNRKVSMLGTVRLMSSRFYNFRRWNHLQRGHQRNIVLASLGTRYNWRDILEINASAYASDQSYEKSSSMQYTVMKQVYVMLSLQGTWQRR